MTNTIQYDNLSVEIRVNKNLKHSYITISNDKKVILKTANSSKSFAIELLKEKSTWIRKQLTKIEKYREVPKEALYPENFLKERLDFFSTLMGLTYTKLTLKKLKSRWGSCNSKREITLNRELLRLPQTLIDYVVVHELAHITYMNHSKSFHALVQTYLPDAKEYRKELKSLRLT
jgi:hypothetical protein